MDCYLCKNETSIRNSHIIPEWMYKKVYDEKHRFTNRANDDRTFFQKGFRKYLLCQKCESAFSKWEKVLQSLWRHTSANS